MKRSIALAVLVLVCAIAASAQETSGYMETSRVSAFGGYSFVHAGINGSGSISVPAGFQGDLNTNINRWFGVEGDLAYSRKSQSSVTASLITFAGGPRFTYHTGRAAIFVHALAGVSRLSGGFDGISASTSAFTYGGGGGLDVAMAKHVSLRVIEADYMTATKFGGRLNTIRIGTGIVARF